MRRSHNSYFGAVGFVLLGVGALAFLLTQLSNRHLSLTAQPMYEVTAAFDNIGELKVGAHVSMSGIVIGRVTRIDFDAVEQKAVVLMGLNSEFSQIPKDSSANINTRGLIGGKFINLTNGGSDVDLKDKDRIASTRSAMSLENTISQVFTRYLKAKSAAIPNTDESANRQ
jgi:phospholipid/cholesterol/gamma-HCH transport system substrate-binding protein